MLRHAIYLRVRVRYGMFQQLPLFLSRRPLLQRYHLCFLKPQYSSRHPVVDRCVLSYTSNQLLAAEAPIAPKESIVPGKELNIEFVLSIQSQIEGVVELEVSASKGECDHVVFILWHTQKSCNFTHRSRRA